MSEKSPDRAAGSADCPEAAKAAPGAAPHSAPEVPTTAPMARLAARVMDTFRVNAEHRRVSGVDSMLEYAAMSAKMRYSPSQRAVLASCGIDPRNYRPLTAMKCRSARAMLTDIIKASGDKPYVLSPSPVPELPESARRRIAAELAGEIARLLGRNGGAFASEDEATAFYVSVLSRAAQMHGEARRREAEWARERCGRMDAKIHDQLVEGGFVEEFGRLVGYLCVYGTGVMVGPCPRAVPACRCRERDTMAGPVVKYERVYEVRPTYEAVSPWDCYPAPNARRVGDGSLCIRVRYTASELWQYAEAMEGRANGPEGWQPRTVRALLSRHPDGGVRLEADAYDMVRRDVERNSMAGDRDCTLEGVRCFGSFRGGDLVGFGILKTSDGGRVDCSRYYRAEVVVVCGYVVYCRVIDDRMPLPLAKATLYESPDCWWGDTIADYLYSAQSLQNNALKNIIQNGAVSSNGLFYCQDVQNVVSLDGSPALAIRAGKMFGFKRGVGGSSGAPIGVVQVPDTTQSQLRLLQAAAQMADDDSGIPQYTMGSSQQLSGAGRTASGLAMMSEAACRVVNMCICGLGRDVIIPVVKATHVYNLLNDGDVSIKGDVEVNPAGLMGRILREAESQRRQQMTSMLGQHPVLSRAITVEGFFELVRPELESIGVNPDKVIPSKERMALYQEIVDMQAVAQAAQPQAQGVGGEPSPEQANVARVEGDPQSVAMEQGGGPRPGTVAERRGAA